MVSDQGTELWAGNNITVEAATQTRDSKYVREESTSGMFDASSGWTWGHQDARTTRNREESTAVGSTVGAIGGNVIITAGNRYSQVGSDVIAPGGDVDILARDVQIVEAREGSRSESTQSFSQSGITLGCKAPLIDTLRNMEETTQAMSDTKDDRMRALGTASMALSGYSTYQGISNDAANFAAGQGAQSLTGGATLMLGQASSETTSTQRSDTALGSHVQAGGNVTITATGGGKDSNILVRGSEISAGKNVNLSADNNVTLEAAANSSSQSSTSHSSNGSIGVGFNVGATSGLTIEMAAGSQSGRDNGTDSGWTNTTVHAGQQVNIASGGDTTLRGATVAGNRINADVGGNLHIETLQDTSTYHSQNSGAGFNASLCIWYCYGESTVSANAHNIRGDGDFASATQQSGFLAGDGGFGVNVVGNTNLVGGVISSTNAAVDSGRNSFATGSLTMSDVINHDVFSGSGYSVTVSTSGSPSGGLGGSHVNQSSITQSGISGFAGNTGVRTGVDSTNGLHMTDRDQAMREIGAQVTITSTASGQLIRLGPLAVLTALDALEGLFAPAPPSPGSQPLTPAQQTHNEIAQLRNDPSLTEQQRADLQVLESFLSGMEEFVRLNSIAVTGDRVLQDQDPNITNMQFFVPPINPGVGGAGGGVAGGAAAGSAAAAGGLRVDPNTGMLISPTMPSLSSIEGVISRYPGMSMLFVAYQTIQASVNAVVGADGYGAGQQPSPSGPTTTPAPAGAEGNSTSTPGTALPGQGTPGYGEPNPATGNTSTSTLNNGPLPGNIVMSQGSNLPIAGPIVAPNGLTVESNPKHTPGNPGYSSVAGTEPKNSLDIFGNSMPGGDGVR